MGKGSKESASSASGLHTVSGGNLFRRKSSKTIFRLGKSTDPILPLSIDTVDADAFFSLCAHHRTRNVTQRLRYTVQSIAKISWGF